MSLLCLVQVKTKGSTIGNCATALFSRPQEVAFDKAGNLDVANGDNNTIRRPPSVRYALVITIVQ